MAGPMDNAPIYFDNAATSFPKPEEVYRACDSALRGLGNPGRGAHRLALDGARTVFEGREALAAFLGLPSAAGDARIRASERLVFTSGCTASINLVLNGLLGASGLAGGDTVLCSSYEHNAVMRPLQWLNAHHGVRVREIAPAADHNGLVDLTDFGRLISAERPRLCVLSLASNVTGEVLDLESAAALCAEHGVPLLIDGAQGCGSLDLNISAHPGITYLAASAHKGLLGPTGLGLLYVAEGAVLDPPNCGGTGSASESFVMPSHMPDRLESGTGAAPLIAGLTAAVAYLERNAAAIRATEADLARYFLQRLGELPRVSVHGRPALAGSETNPHTGSHLPTFALSFDGIGADIAADRLDREYDIATRPGLHCAVAAHRTLGTVSGGLLRVSFGHANNRVEVDKLCQALQTILD